MAPAVPHMGMAGARSSAKLDPVVAGKRLTGQSRDGSAPIAHHKLPDTNDELVNDHRKSGRALSSPEMEKPGFGMSSEKPAPVAWSGLAIPRGRFPGIQAEMALPRRRARSAVPEMPRRSIDVGSGTGETSA